MVSVVRGNSAKSWLRAAGSEASGSDECVTKGWEAKDKCDKMAHVSFTYGKSASVDGFTFPSKRGAPPTPAWLRSAAAILMLFAFGEPVAAHPQIGPTSSTNVGISVSVSAKYGLRANEAGIRALEDGAVGFCMTTNGQPVALSVHLVRYSADELAAGRMFKEQVAPLHWCAAGSSMIDPVDRGDHTDKAALLIVRPE